MKPGIACNGIILSLAVVLSACSTTQNATTASVESTAYTLKSGGHIPALQQGVSVEHATLNFAFDFNNEVLFGDTTLRLTSESAKPSVSVDLDTVFTIDEVQLNGQIIQPEHYTNTHGELIITPTSAPVFPLTVSVKYHGHPRTPPNAPWDGGVMWEQTPNGKPWLATAVQGEGCDIFWPCIDHPMGEPKTADIFITVPKGLVAASNGVLVDTTTTAEQSTYHWQTRSAHNTYGIALNVGPYDKVESTYHSVYGNSYPIVYYYLAGNGDKAQQLFDEIPPMLTFFERMIGPYPFADEKVGIVQTPHLGMEHQTINAYGNEYKKDEFGFDWLLQHEFAHEYFGNQVTNDNWDHMWIHEGLGSYMQPLFAQYLNGDLAYKTYLNNQRKGLINTHPIVSGKEMEVEQVYERGVGPALDIYYKGSWIMHTLRYLIGDQAFFDSVKILLYGTANPMPGQFSTLYRNTGDFINIVNKQTGQDLNWFFNVYLYQPELPEILQQRSDTKLKLSWLTPGDLPFPMPVEVSVNGKVTTLHLPQQNTLSVTPKDVVIVDPQSKLLRVEPRYNHVKR
ncbi:M1 family metallopeptidase [Alteromonas lipolytica]|uniref:Peptidase M1 n=1 Tax=Alteromonas lipolytica TaxID=1856405 RepID=A0A1E8FE71_9ALTE|nr:M1 family metallopeptidase [Alteromonas lipolytica]OFI33888.1 peptidase M1 [Alteromonas lipolytica]GGF67506.1 peptidase M1 [Alteromonas lipolytica]